MAPDLTKLFGFRTDGYASNGVERDSDYEIPDIILGAPTVRKIKILSVGAGVSGIMNAYLIEKELENVEHVIYEKNPDIGGTWLENRYPGCGCDIPSHAYTFPFALNPDWPRFFSYAPDIWSYLDKVCEVFNLRRFMNFNSKVIGAYWQDDTSEWKVDIEQTLPDGTTRVSEERCHVLLYGTGILNNYKWPKVDGLDRFEGKIVHTANWPQNYQAEQWSDDRVAVIGSGASSIQTVPTMQPHVKHMDIFVRTGVWFVQIANNYGQNYSYLDEEIKQFHDSPSKMVHHAKDIESQVNSFWESFMKGSNAQKQGQIQLKERMASFIKDERLLKGFTPSFGIGCRRVTPGDPYMMSIQQPNVDVHFTAVQSVTPTGIVGADGIEREVDTIICATGFDVSYRPRFPIIGRNGVSLSDKWKEYPEGYLGLGVPDFPNFLICIGPNWPIENGSVMGPLYYVGLYTIKLIKKLQTEYIASLTPKQGITDLFNAHCQEWVRHTVWTENCRSWYKNNETGRVNAVWPGSSLHYIEVIKEPRYEDFDIEYLGPAKRNPWAYLGLGTVRALVEKTDTSPYFNLSQIDDKWAKAMRLNMDEEKSAVQHSQNEQKSCACAERCTIQSQAVHN